MKDKLISNYISKLKKEDIKAFSSSNNILLNENEVNTIYDIIKNNYKDLLYGNHDYIFNYLKNNVTKDNYDKIINLFFEYKKKYSYFL